ncbi:MAG: AAA family ATPase [Isosphaeraceae bacterium]
MRTRDAGRSTDPFSEVDAPFIPTAVHAEAVARLVYVIESGQRLATLYARPGLGKTMVLRRALELARGPGRRIVKASGPIDGLDLLTTLAERSGRRLPPKASRADAWRALTDSARVCRLQRLAIVLVIDDAQRLTSPADQLDLDRLPHLDPHPEACVTVIQVGRDADIEPASDPWTLAIRLAPLTRTETSGYLNAKLAAAGRDQTAFTPKAVTLLHALTSGVPRGIDRLASLALIAGEARGLEMITPDVIDGVARECVAVVPY